MQAKKEIKAISCQKSKVTIENYQIIENGYFNPICQSGYNFLTGLVECKIGNDRKLDFNSKSGLSNGSPCFNY